MTLYMKGDILAFEKLYERYSSRLMKFFNYRLNQNQKHRAYDLFQITWLKIHQGRSSFKKELKFSSWFFRIAINSLRDLFRSEKKHLNDIELLEKDIEIDSDTELKMELSDLEKKLNQLSPNQKEILLLSHWEGFSSQEIAEILSMTDIQVRKILSRTIQSIRSQI